MIINVGGEPGAWMQPVGLPAEIVPMCKPHDRWIGNVFQGKVLFPTTSTAQFERFNAPFYPKWDRDRYYSLVEKLGLSRDHPVGKMSCGQRSQVVLGLLMAQRPELLILDDYSMGLDAGYRRIFLGQRPPALPEAADSDRSPLFQDTHVRRQNSKGKVVFQSGKRP